MFSIYTKVKYDQKKMYDTYKTLLGPQLLDWDPVV